MSVGGLEKFDVGTCAGKVMTKSPSNNHRFSQVQRKKATFGSHAYILITEEKYT